MKPEAIAVSPASSRLSDLFVLTKVRLNAPYSMRAGDTWIVTKQMPGDRKAGPVVMRPRV